MSWQLASFLLLALALGGGFAWYERSHPSARVLALVGTLAALAVLGRIAFAPVPNVKPTTDLVLLSGFVFGGAPGFAVGAVAALASNFFFAQGPWTPWQMLAWGGVGIAGAGLARVGGGRLGRLPLAVACGLAGLAFGVVVNFGSVVTFGGGDVGRRFLAYQATSLPWDIAHAVGNVAFFLLFGPALVRTLRRFRTRLAFTWNPHPAGIAVALAAALTTGLAAHPRAASGASEASCSVVAPGPLDRTLPCVAHAASAPGTRTADYLLNAQNDDGGFGSTPGRRSAGLYTGWTVLGLVAQHRNPLRAPAGGHSAIDYIRAHARPLTRDGSATGIGDLERTILTLRASGLSPRSFAGKDLVASLTARVSDEGAVLRQVNLTAFAVLALRAGGTKPDSLVLRRAGAWLASQQDDDGGWGFIGGSSSDVDDTAAVMQALAALGGHKQSLKRAVAYIRGTQNADGGLPQQHGGTSNAQSTAWAIQGLLAAGVRPESLRRNGASSPLVYLRSLVGPDGAVRYSRSSLQTPVWVTAYAALALARRPLPLLSPIKAVEAQARRHSVTRNGRVPAP